MRAPDGWREDLFRDLVPVTIFVKKCALEVMNSFFQLRISLEILIAHLVVALQAEAHLAAALQAVAHLAVTHLAVAYLVVVYQAVALQVHRKAHQAC